MLKKVADNQDKRSLAAQFRKKRFVFFNSLLLQLNQPISILDVGGSEAYWKVMEMDNWDRIHVTLINLTKEEITLPNTISTVGDARNLDFDDKSFDVVFSNSVIEHVGNYTDQMHMAKEVRRVGKRYFIQTPNKNFPLEPHFLFPFFQFLPIQIRIRLLERFNLGWFPRTPDEKTAREIVEGIQLLGKHQFAELFPTAKIYEEKALWMTKSFIAYEGWDE